MMKAVQKRETTRRVDFELIRSLAIFCVIFNHTAGNGFFLFASYTPGLRYWFYLTLAILCKVGVPLFLAISGALLLRRQDTDCKLCKRAARIMAALVLFSFLGYLQLITMGEENPFELSVFLTRLYDQRWIKAYWYLYAYLAFLMAIPFLRVVAQQLEKRYFLYLFWLSVLLNGVVPVIQYLVFDGQHTLCSYFVDACWFLNQVVLYPLLGYSLTYVCTPEEKKHWLYPLWGIALAGVVVSCLMTTWKAVRTGECNENVSQTFFNCFVMILCAAVFLSVQVWTTSHAMPSKLQQAVLSVGQCSFGIYLIHVLVMRFSFMGRFFAWLRELLPPLPMTDVLLYCVVVLLFSWGITRLVRIVPFFQKLL